VFVTHHFFQALSHVLKLLLKALLSFKDVFKLRLLFFRAAEFVLLRRCSRFNNSRLERLTLFQIALVLIDGRVPPDLFEHVLVLLLSLFAHADELVYLLRRIFYVVVIFQSALYCGLP
jgi:hypothetical protein